MKKVTVAAVLTAFLAACSLISIPNIVNGVAITLQVFAVAFCGYLVGVKLSVCVLTTYVVLGIIGVPIFSGFMGGPYVLVGATGGFIVGFFGLAIACGLAGKVTNKLGSVALSLLGLAVCHFCGVLHYSFFTNGNFWGSALTVSAPFLLKDVCLILLAKIFAKTVKKSLKKSKIEL